MFLPSKKGEEALADRIIGALVVVFQEELQNMSQALTDKLTELGTKEDQVIALINTDVSTIGALQAANAALAASQGDDSAEVASVQALIDKLTPVITPPVSALSPPAPVADPPVAAPPVAGN